MSKTQRMVRIAHLLPLTATEPLCFLPSHRFLYTAAAVYVALGLVLGCQDGAISQFVYMALGILGVLFLPVVMQD